MQAMVNQSSLSKCHIITQTGPYNIQRFLKEYCKFIIKIGTFYCFCSKHKWLVHTIYVLEQKEEKIYTPVNPNYTI